MGVSFVTMGGVSNRIINWIQRRRGCLHRKAESDTSKCLMSRITRRAIFPIRLPA